MRTILGLVAALAIGGEARALTAFSVGAVAGQDPGYAGQTLLASFDAPNIAGVTETDSGAVGSVALFTGTHPDIAAAPIGDTTRYEALQVGGVAKFDFSAYAPGVSTLSFFVGSIDAYNWFSVKTNARTYYYNGRGFLVSDGNQFSSSTNRRVYFQFAPGETLQTLTLRSTGIAFEYDTLAAAPRSGGRLQLNGPSGFPLGSDALTPYAVPEPATWAMMLSGLAMIGAGVRRRSALAS